MMEKSMKLLKNVQTPEEVLQSSAWSMEQKIEILRRWEQDQQQLAVAVEEGMPGPEPKLLGRIVKALASLEKESTTQKREKS